MTDEQTPDTPGGTTSLEHAADKVAGSADELAGQLALFRQELHDAGEKATHDIAAAKKKAADDVAAERKDRRRSNWRFLIVVLADIALSLFLYHLYDSEKQTNAQLEQSLRQDYTTAQQQAQTRVQVLCPLYGMLQTLASAPNPDVAPTPQKTERIAKALSTIEDGYRKLGCKPALPAK